MLGGKNGLFSFGLFSLVLACLAPPATSRPMRHHALVLGMDPFDDNIKFASYTLEAHGIPHTVKKMRDSVLVPPSTAPLGLDNSWSELESLQTTSLPLQFPFRFSACIVVFFISNVNALNVSND